MVKGLDVRQQAPMQLLDVSNHSGTRIVDYDREELVDIFAGSEMEALTGASLGEKIEIESYNPGGRFFTMAGDFSSDISEQNYKILVHDETPFKTRQGSSFTQTIPLIHKGGLIDRLEFVPIKVQVKIPQFAQSAGTFLFDLNMKFSDIGA